MEICLSFIADMPGISPWVCLSMCLLCTTHGLHSLWADVQCPDMLCSSTCLHMLWFCVSQTRLLNDLKLGKAKNSSYFNTKFSPHLSSRRTCLLISLHCRTKGKVNARRQWREQTERELLDLTPYRTRKKSLR